MINTDLHIHSQFSSDGELSVIDIINRCLNRKIDIFSITDHNSVKGVSEAIFQSQKVGIHCMPGIEIDCNYKGINLHLLGYNIDFKSKDFKQLEDDIYTKVMASLDEMVYNIQKLGFIIDADSVLAKSHRKLPTGELIAEVMLSDERYYSAQLSPYISGGARSDMPYINFYLDYFAQGKPAFVSIEYMSFRDAIQIIKDNGGVPIVAHPGLNLKGREFIVKELIDNGADGFELFNNYHSFEQISYFASIAKQIDVIITCGSDFHGHNKPLIDIGQFNYDKGLEEHLKKSVKLLMI